MNSNLSRKMILVCVIVSLALSNVLEAALDTYDKEVIKTNRYIASGINDMPKIIKNIVLGPYTMEEMAFMVAIPEYPAASYYKLLLSQIKMQTEIITETGIQLPEINEDNYATELNLANAGRARRLITAAATKALIVDETHGGDEVTKYFEDFSDMCLLLGLLRSIKNPHSYIVAAEIDETVTCTLTDINLNEFRYRSIDGVIWELKPNDQLIGPLSDQL